MQSVSNASLAALEGKTLQIRFRADNRHAERAEHKHEHEDHVKSRHGRKRAAQIFRQEISQALKMKFHSQFRLSINSLNPYRDSQSAEGVAADVLATARSVVAQNPDEPSKTLLQVRESVEQALSASKSVVNTAEGESALDATDGLIQRGLDALESNPALLAASSLSVESSSRQRSTIKIRTQEGDIVKFDLRRVDKFSASDTAVQTDSASASLTEISISSRSRLILKVEGDLNEAELEAIRNVFAQAEQIAEDFFSGDINAALEVVAGLEFDSAQLARVSMKFRSSERISAQQTVLTSAPTAPAAESAAPTTPALAPAGAVAAAPTDTDLAASVSTPEVELAPVATDDTSESAGPLSSLASLFDYLGKIADYLERTFDHFDGALLQGASITKIRFEFSESLRLDILRAVMIETAPEQGERDEDSSGGAIQQLAKDLD